MEAFTPHDLRHFYASGLIAEGCDVVTVQSERTEAPIVLSIMQHGEDLDDLLVVVGDEPHLVREDSKMRPPDVLIDQPIRLRMRSDRVIVLASSD